MTAIDVMTRNSAPNYRLSLWVAIRAAWHTYRSICQQQKALIALSCLSPRLIRDIGLDPDTVYGELHSAWDETRPNKRKDIKTDVFG